MGKKEILTSKEIERLRKSRKVHLGYIDNSAEHGVTTLCGNRRMRFVVEANEVDEVTCIECRQILMQKVACWDDEDVGD